MLVNQKTILINYNGIQDSNIYYPCYCYCSFPFCCRLVNIKNRADKLLDKSLDGLINDNLYKSKSKEMMLEEVEIIERITNLNVTNSNFKLRVNNFLELAESLYLSYIVADKQKKAIIAKSLFSNLVASDGKLLLSTTFPYYLLEDTHGILYCGQY